MPSLNGYQKLSDRVISSKKCMSAFLSLIKTSLNSNFNILFQARQVLAVALPVQVRARQREAPAVQGDAGHAGLLRPHHQEQAVRTPGPRQTGAG